MTREPADKPEIGTSVVICTYNGGRRIARVLSALVSQVGQRPFEVILVDNCSTDGVSEIARDFWDRAGRSCIPLHVVREAQQGLSYARHRGALEAKYELVLFCDDDNLLCPGYVDEAARLMDDPRFAAVGGPGIPVFETDPPSYVFSRIGFWACGDRYGASDEVGAEHVVVSDNDPRNLFGAGLTVRRADILNLFALSGFPVLTDRSGGALSGGNDCEICFMLAISGGMLVYSEKLRFQHIIPPERLTHSYLNRLITEGGAGRKYWQCLADCLIVRRGGDDSLRPISILRVIMGLLTGSRDRRRIFRLALRLGLTAAMNKTERLARKMARSAEALPRARPVAPRSVTLSTRVSGIEVSAADHAVPAPRNS
ncbi:glycosyltransferase family 2 protein [Limibaculum sp. FT325]|uniref:glycosyltransferase n=1 Tax=Thermohalobaculum sediminis TaxID=2939436 RepID=UPI0020C16D02|nr:glycosyltransferase [Limibaculum sediminis]MCL5776865.1 glycosyltransferase family 2 protein [Limibaculum sediminis]